MSDVHREMASIKGDLQKLDPLEEKVVNNFYYSSKMVQFKIIYEPSKVWQQQ